MMKNPMIKWGVYYGVASSALMFLLWVINKDLLFNMAMGLVTSLAFAIAFLVLAMRETRTINEGYLGYGEAVKIGLGTFAIAALVSGVFTFLLYNIIDGSLYDLEKAKAIESVEKIAASFGASDEVIEDAVAESRDAIESMGSNKGIGTYLQEWLLSVIIYGLPCSLIISAFMKKS
ncbi:MAG: DUF4199 domain-containing protein [Bacteroidota bacterium]